MLGAAGARVPGESAAERRSGRALDPPTVLFVSSHSLRGGSERVLEDLVGALPPAAVLGVVALQDGPLVTGLQRAGVPVEVLPTGPSPAAMAASALRLSRRRGGAVPDVVHANGVKAALVATLARALAPPARRRPVVWMKHDVTLDGPVGRALARRCAAVPCVSEEVRRGIGRSGRSLVVHPGVRADAAGAATAGADLRRSLDLPGPVVAVVGRLDPAKGHGELLEALPRLRRSVPGVTLLLVGGDDPQHPGVARALHRRAAELGATGAVRLPGHVDAAAVLGAADVVCVPTVPRPDGSGREGFGLVAAEALVLGVPVVGYDVGATREVLGGCGTLVPAGDRDGLADAVTALLTRPELRAAARACGQSRADALSVERMAGQLLDVYRQVRP